MSEAYQPPSSTPTSLDLSQWGFNGVPPPPSDLWQFNPSWENAGASSLPGIDMQSRSVPPYGTTGALLTSTLRQDNDVLLEHLLGSSTSGGDHPYAAVNNAASVLPPEYWGSDPLAQYVRGLPRPRR